MDVLAFTALIVMLVLVDGKDTLTGHVLAYVAIFLIGLYWYIDRKNKPC